MVQPVRQALCKSKALLQHRSIFTSLQRRALSHSFSTQSPAAATTTNNDNTKPWYYHNPSQIMTGTTTQDLENNPKLAAYFAANFPTPPPSLESYHEEQKRLQNQQEEKENDVMAKLNIRPLTCYLRDREREDGSRACRRMREKDRMIPGIIHGNHPNLSHINEIGEIDRRIWVKTPLSGIQRERDLYSHSFASRVYQLMIQDEKSQDVVSELLVVPSNVNLHPVLNKAYCVNYLRYHPGRVLKIPIRYMNEEESPALKRGGFIVPINRFLKCLVEEGVPIPEYIELDCTGVRLKEKLRMDRLVIPEGVKVCKSVNQKEFLVGPVFGRGIKTEDEEQSV